MLVKKLLTRGAGYNPQKFKSTVDQTIKRLQGRRAPVLLAIWGRIVSDDPQENNRLYAEIFFSFTDPKAPLDDSEVVVSVINPIILGKARERTVEGFMKGTQRGNTVYPLELPKHRRSLLGYWQKGL